MSDVYSCRPSCKLLSVVAGIIIGIVTAILTFTATITVTPVFYWVTLGVALLFLLASPFIAQTSGDRRFCLCPVIRVFLIGILGTILSAFILLLVGFAATSVIGAIFTGLLFLFFSLIITAMACIVKCLSGCRG